MKALKLFAAIAVCLFTVSASAQVVVPGGVSMPKSISSDNSKPTLLETLLAGGSGRIENEMATTSCPVTECGTDSSCVGYGKGTRCEKFSNGNSCCMGAYCGTIECGTDKSCQEYGKGTTCTHFPGGNACCTGGGEGIKGGAGVCQYTECGTDESCKSTGKGTTCTPFANGNSCCTGEIKKEPAAGGAGGVDANKECPATECGTDESCVAYGKGNSCVRYSNGNSCCIFRGGVIENEMTPAPKK